MDYSKGKIYKIIDESNNDNYYGSTIQILEDRFRTHGMFSGYNKSKKKCKIELVENYPCESKRELEKREQYYIDTYDCINKSDAVCNPEKRRKQIRECNAKRLVELRVYKNDWHTERQRYEKTWGGDKRFHNNLLTIDTDLFT
tara:strand:+ start:52 stop:480 length:429 start_codon:yes stop_codon:yes gene_type:complete